MLKYRFSHEKEGSPLAHAIAARSGIYVADVKKLIKQGRVRLNGEVAADREVRVGDIAEIYLAEKLAAYESEPEIAYEDSEIMLVTKNPLTPCTGEKKKCATMLDMAVRYMREVGEYSEAADRVPVMSMEIGEKVGGILLIAKNHLADMEVKEAMRERRIAVKYMVVISGHMPAAAGELHDYVEMYNGRPRITGRQTRDARHIVTRYTVLAVNDRYSILEIDPVTDIPWQVRMHLAYNGTPVVGDMQLGDKKEAKALGIWEPAMFLERIVFQTGKGCRFSYLNGREFEVAFELPILGKFTDM